MKYAIYLILSLIFNILGIWNILALQILIPIPPIPIVTPNLSASIPTTLSIPIGDNPVRIATLGSNISIYILPFVKYLAVSHQGNEISCYYCYLLSYYNCYSFYWYYYYKYDSNSCYY